MKAVILAAGTSSRLHPTTLEKHKCLLQVGGIPIIDRMLQAFKKAGVTESIIVVGHAKEKIMQHVGENYQGMPITYVYSPIYKHTNNIFSMWQTKDLVKETGFLFSNADNVFNYKIIKELIECPHPNAAVVDTTEPFRIADSPKVIIKEGNVTELGRHIKDEDVCGASAGMFKFSAAAARHYFAEIEKHLEDGHLNVGFHIPMLVAANRDFEFKSCDSKGYMWFDVDDAKDLEDGHILVKIIEEQEAQR